jgi:nucleoside-diphosphate-sugar epimerase
VRVAIGRASDFFGPGVQKSAMGEQVFYPALAGKLVRVLGNPDLPHTYSYIPDVGRGLVMLGERDEALGQAWHLPSAPTVSTRRFLELVCAEAGQPLRLQSTPKWLIQGLGLFSPNIRELVEMVYEFEEAFILDHSKFERTFGNQATPLAEAIRTTVSWFRQNPKNA